ncbi:hypothetical protein BU25DRAFT_432229 [Macroventuria anomochaeta]|uniref:Uncharacterized protein n=1 Tax=Macroventuria anomochaeta TaxID=301207 RepID=A0ACB6RXE6_9PLEO|nr:uncharacterized protein BU25DRAFT_432229 [Macroventuria anomochaeta]KAF2626448.1 hypothetical protein BU25DRAFT_432229 [Macroventuria anomochaeta]
MEYFAPQLHAEQQSTLSLRASQYRKKRRNRHHDEQDDDEHSSSSCSGSDVDKKSRSLRSNAHSHPSFASAELAQLRVAGLLPEEEYRAPSSPFPHAPARVSKPYLGTAKIQKELAGPPSRLFTVNNTATQSDHASSQTEASNLRRTHLNVLSTVMHRCLLEGDYDRAGRAWGMILRTQATHGSTVDLRNHGRWAVGAEILLRRKPQGVASNSRDQPDGAADTDTDTDTDTDIFSEQGFELAREYYERLIVQHPTRKQAPHAVDQRSFYPAMFSLWIQEVNEKSKRARKRNIEDARRSRSRIMSIDSGDGKSMGDARAREDAVQVEELAQARELAERLDDLVKSPPFDKQASLLQLRGNVALWISDLIVGNTAATAMDEWDVYPISKETPAAEQATRFSNCQRELHTAQNYLSRVEENGGSRQYHTLEKIESRLKELQKQITKLEIDGEDDTNVSMEEGW